MNISDINVVLPQFKDTIYNIQNYGAEYGSNCAESINKAIADCSENGGGTVLVPRGVWCTGPIELKSNVNFQLEDGAILLFSDDYKDYPLVFTSFEGFDMYRCQSPIYGHDLENVAITGKGIIDGNGYFWRPIKKWKLTQRQWDELTATGGYVDKGKEEIWWPDEKNAEADKLFKEKAELYKDKETCQKYHRFLRPALLHLSSCKNVLIDGPTIQNSPAWALHPWLCENVTIRNTSIRNPWFSQNGDGLDLDSCKNCKIYDCTFDVGDDAICMKSGKNEDGRKRAVPTENVSIENCVVYHGHGGFVIGSEMSGGLKNIFVNNCSFIGTDVGLRFKSCLGRGGVVEDIHISNIDMTDIPGEAIIFTMGYNMDTKEGQPVAEDEIPEFKNIFIEGVRCTGAKIPISISGLPQMPVHDITLKDIVIYSNGEEKEAFAENITKDNVKILRKH